MSDDDHAESQTSDDDLHVIGQARKQLLDDELEDFDKFFERVCLSYETDFADRVRSERKSRGWSQEELASKVTDLGFEMFQSTLARLEAKRRPIRISEAVALSTVFTLDPLTMFYGPSPAAEPRTLGDLRDELKNSLETLDTVRSGLDSMAKTYVDMMLRTERLARDTRRAARLADQTDKDEGDASSS